MPEPPPESTQPVGSRRETPLPQQPPKVSPQAAVPDTAPPEAIPPQTIPPQTAPPRAASQPRVVPQTPEPKPATVPQRAPKPERRPVPAATRAVPKAPVAPSLHRPETAATHARSSRTADATPGRSSASASSAGSGASTGQEQTHAAADPSWLADVSAWLQAHRSYPEMARAMGRQGTVVVQITVDPAGHVVGFNLIRGSGTQSLDQAAEALMRNAQLPPFPPDMRLPRQSLTVPIHYQLD
ncbi:energy transducer TonB [Rhodopila sp.]|uniref:energy transducer TonB n=1 Tax=Rhodopila sp. TaxID=2480087 RepID=UPI003D1366CD